MSTWTTAEGQEVPIRELGGSHLRCIKRMLRGWVHELRAKVDLIDAGQLDENLGETMADLAEREETLSLIIAEMKLRGLDQAKVTVKI